VPRPPYIEVTKWPGTHSFAVRLITLTPFESSGHPDFMMNLLFALLLSVSAFATSREEAVAHLVSLQSIESTQNRMDAASKVFLGLPYGNGGPLGEGETGRYDQDPLYRFDTFDCTTFVETIVSLALTRDVESFEAHMDKIRYENSQVDYLTRNHDPSLNWVPNNLKNGIFTEINHLILPASQRKMAEAVLDLPNWLKKIQLSEIRVPQASDTERMNLLEELRAMSSQYQPVLSKLEYLPINTLVAMPKVLKLIPNGTVVSFVRPNWDLTDTLGMHINVSHQGLIFQRKEGPILRHASTTGLVMEVSLLDYLKKYVNHATMKGIHLLKVN
jgi:hypothetical protein